MTKRIVLFFFGFASILAILLNMLNTEPTSQQIAETQNNFSEPKIKETKPETNKENNPPQSSILNNANNIQYNNTPTTKSTISKPSFEDYSDKASQASREEFLSTLEKISEENLFNAQKKEILASIITNNAISNNIASEQLNSNEISVEAYNETIDNNYDHMLNELSNVLSQDEFRILIDGYDPNAKQTHQYKSAGPQETILEEQGQAAH